MRRAPNGRRADETDKRPLGHARGEALPQRVLDNRGAVGRRRAHCMEEPGRRRKPADRGGEGEPVPTPPHRTQIMGAWTAFHRARAAPEPFHRLGSLERPHRGNRGRNKRFSGDRVGSEDTDMETDSRTVQRSALTAAHEHAVGNLVRRAHPARVPADAEDRTRAVPLTPGTTPAGPAVEERVETRPRQAPPCPSLPNTRPGNAHDRQGTVKQGKEERMKRRITILLSTALRITACSDNGATSPVADAE